MQATAPPALSPSTLRTVSSDPAGDRFQFWAFVSFLGFGGCAGLVKLIELLFWNRSYKKIERETLPFFDRKDIYDARTCYIRTKLQDLCPSDLDEPGSSHAHFISEEDGIQFFLRRLTTMVSERDSRYYLILADSGMGKTTFLLNLLIAHSCHFGLHRLAMKLAALGHPDCDDNIKNYPTEERSNTILLLDAFDEDPKAFENCSERLDSLARELQGFYKVLITCRRQFFGAETEIPAGPGLRSYGTQVMPVVYLPKYVAPFTEDDVARFLKKRFRWNSKKRSIAAEIVRKAPSLMARPMLLGHVHVLLEKGVAEFTKTAEIYERLVTFWIEREAEKARTAPNYREQKTQRKKYEKQLWKFSNDLAVQIWDGRISRRGFYISIDEITRLANEKKIDLDTLTRRDISSRSLLNTCADGRYKFAHMSILEYFLARGALADSNLAGRLHEANYEGVSQAITFLKELLEMPWPSGRQYSGTLSELSNAINCGNQQDLEYLMTKDSEGVHMICWHSTPATTVRTALLSAESLIVHLWYRRDVAMSAESVAEWCSEAKSERIKRVWLRGFRFPHALNILDAFHAEFSQQNLSAKLRTVN
jgi:hypothetical protein